jgi:hypothetical protein
MRARLVLPAVLAGFLTIPLPAAALTAGDVVDKMTADERAAFVIGAVTMAQRFYELAGNERKVACIRDWYRSEGRVRQVHGVFSNYKDRDAASLLHVLINRHCGE